MNTEIAPIVGSEEQANDHSIAYIREGQQSEEGAWETNIFGKSVGELMKARHLQTKIAMMDDECQMKLQDTMQKIVNDNNGGWCVLLYINRSFLDKAVSTIDGEQGVFDGKRGGK